MPGKLFIVPTPVGNMSDMTPRALQVLSEAHTVYAEDTRVSGKLLAHFGIDKPMVSFHKFNEHAILDKALQQLHQGQIIALVSDAGTPGISDPGFLLTRACRKEGIEVETLPGATAFVPALVNSGLPCERFFFEGFLPAKKGRRTRLEQLAALDVTFIIYESPLRLVRTLEELQEVCGAERPASVSREISKIHNTTINGTLQEIKEHFTVNNPRGEIVIIVEGNNAERPKRIHQNKYKDQNQDKK